MNSTRCTPRRSLQVFAALFTVTVSVLWLAHQAAGQDTKTDKRPLTHNDYDLWKTIQQAAVSPDGKFAAYTLVPQDGDSELIVKELSGEKNAKEYKHTRGKSGGFAAGAKGPVLEAVGGSSVAFTLDSKYVVFTIAPPKSAGDKKTPAEQPKNAVGIMDTATGKVTVVPNVSSWTLPEENPQAIIYLKYPPGEAAKKDGDGKSDEDAEEDQQGKKGGDKKGGGITPKTTRTPSDCVLHNLADGKEMVVANVTDYSVSRDGRVFICVVAPKDGEQGVYVYARSDKKPGELDQLPLAVGKARYSRLTWSDDQRSFAFIADRSEPKEPPALSVYRWDRGGPLPKPGENGAFPPAAVELLTSKTPGLKEGMVLVERGGLRFSEDGSKLYLGAALPTPPEKEATKDSKDAKDAKDEKAVVELWHYKDDFIQPMQKVRALQEKMRTFTAIYHIDQKRLVQLADKNMENVILSRDGSIGLGTDDTPYRALVSYDTNYVDYYLVNTFDATRRILLKKHRWGVSFAPSGRLAIFYDGKDWNSVSLPNGVITNITKSIPETSFASEDWDQPSQPPPYGIMGWSSDEAFVILYDRYDIWQVEAKGGGYRCLTAGLPKPTLPPPDKGKEKEVVPVKEPSPQVKTPDQPYRIGRKENVQIRYVKLDPKEKSIDLSKTMLVRFENLVSRQQGFATLDPRGKEGPKSINVAPVNFGAPIRAKFSDVILLTVSTYFDFPDLYFNHLGSNQFTKISDANPQKNNFVWGMSDVVHYKSADGTPLSGMLIVPENFDRKKKYPMIVYIYEKLSQNVHHFVLPAAGTSINPTFYASNGYVVFMPDITYNTGYPGQSALKCVLPGIQAVVDKGFINEDAIGIQGHSWGGYQIAYMITQTGRFKAAAAGAPVSNMTSAYNGIRWGSGLPRQFQYEKSQSRIGGSLWQYPMRFVENSPVFMADRVKTPLMMLHNDQDDAVPWYQGIEYYLSLRRLGKEVYMFNYPGERHGLTKKANQKDYTIRMQQFFDHHLKGAPAPDWMVRGIPYEPRPAQANPAVAGDDD
jgi:dipeptidyl aminopeptidase/acylaminoacyl peptidase